MTHLPALILLGLILLGCIAWVGIILYMSMLSMALRLYIRINSCFAVLPDRFASRLVLKYTSVSLVSNLILTHQV